MESLYEQRVLKNILLFALVIVVSIPSVALAAETPKANNEEVVVYSNPMSEKERQAEHIRQIEEQLRKLNKKDYKVVLKSNKVAITSNDDAGEYKNELGTKKYATASGYAGNQPKRGTKFPTGGGFFYSDSGGPSASISIYFPKPFSNVAFNVNLGNSSTSGTFINAPNKTDYFKLYVKKTYEIQPYIVYIKEYYGDFGEWKWVKWSSGYSKILYSAVSYAKKQ